jgi:hypothetical protein
MRSRSPLILLALFLLALPACTSAQKPIDPPPAISRSQTTPIALETLPTCAPIPDQDKKAILDFLLRHAAAASALGAGESGGFDAYMDMFHYPTIRIANGKLTLLNTPADIEKEAHHAVDHPFPADYWRSEWTRLLIIDASPDKVHLATTFNRQRKDGSVIETSNGFYILDKVNNHWGIRARSSFAPIPKNN